MRVLSLPLGEYLALSNESLFDRRSSETICIVSAMDEAQVRLYTFVSPKDHCWGMEIAGSRAYEDWFDQLTRRSDLLQLMKREIKAARHKLAEIALGLLPVGGDEDGYLLYGSEENALYTFWFRSYVLPADADEKFTSLWQEHETQLGKFFLLPYADRRVQSEGLGECTSSSRSTDLLCRLFWDRHGHGGADVQEQLELLSQYEDDEAKAHDLNALLKPDFLLQEYVRWSTSLLPPVSSLQKLSAEVYEEMFGSLGKQAFGGKTKVAMLRMRLARMLLWPLGVRLLAKQVEPYAAMKAKPALVQETELYVGQALAKYPVLTQ